MLARAEHLHNRTKRPGLGPAVLRCALTIAMMTRSAHRRDIILSLLAGVLLSALLAAAPAAALDSELMPFADRSLLLDGQVVGGRAVVVGERGHILISEDQGRSWQQQTVPTRATLTSLFFVDEMNGWAAGHDAVILRTIDGGRNWQQVYSDPEDERPIFDLWFRDLRHGYAVGAYGLIQVTEDGGQSWAPLDFEPATFTDENALGSDPWMLGSEDAAWGIDYHFNEITATSDGRLFIAAEAGHLYRSDDAGRSWIDMPSPYEGSFYGCLPLDSQALLLYGLRGHLFRSNDAGADWQELTTGMQATLNDGIVLRDGRIVLVGLAGALLISDDGGLSFQARPRPDRAGIARVLETTDGALLLIGEQGVRRLELPPVGGGAP